MHMSEVESDAPPRVLVTGATGFAGGHLARALKRRGYAVRALARRGADIRSLIDHGIEICAGDLLHADQVDRAVAGTSKVFHIAAVYRSAKHPDSYYHAVNVGGTGLIIDAARRHGVKRVIHCSTVGVHGAVTEIPSDENSQSAPGDVYQHTKLAGEQLVRQALSDGLPGVVVRPAGIYGPGDMRFLKLFKAIHRGRFRMFGTGEVLYHLTYIDDLVNGIILCGEQPEALGQTYILAGERYVTLNELVRLTAAAVGVPAPRGHLPLWPLMMAATLCEWVCRPLRIEPPLYRRRVEFFIKDRAFSIEKARRELGYQPRVDLAEGLRRTARWYFENGLLFNGGTRQPPEEENP